MTVDDVPTRTSDHDCGRVATIERPQRTAQDFKAFQIKICVEQFDRAGDVNAAEQECCNRITPPQFCGYLV